MKSAFLAVLRALVRGLEKDRSSASVPRLEKLADGRRKISPAAELVFMSRLQAGESRTALADEAGVSYATMRNIDLKRASKRQH
jgi:hypothetical protein